MTAVTQNISTSQQGLGPMPEFADQPVNGTAHILAGTMVALNTDGDLVMVTATTGLKVLGRADEEKDNTSGNDGDLVCRVRYGVFPWAMVGGDEVDRGDIGATVYAADNNTVGKTDGGGTRSSAGVLVDVDEVNGLAYVLQGPLPSAGLSVVAGGLQKATKTVGQADLSGTTAQTIDFASALPTGAMLLGTQVNLVTPFTGGGVSSLDLDVGKAGAIEAYIKDLDILGSSAGYYSFDGTPTAPPPVSASGVTIRLTFTPDGGTNMTALTAGSLTVIAYYVV
jgi:hypothetical protein